jgi:pimeloyl-ACP methyl ester carboxylesterase
LYEVLEVFCGVGSSVIKEVVVGQSRWQVSDVGQGTPLLLVHGFPLDHSMWREQIVGLQDHCRVIAPDLVGFGKSECVARDDDKLSMSQFADDLATLLDQLEVSESVIFCGLSMGGYIGWEFYRRHRDRVARLVMCDTRAAADTKDVARGRLMMAQKTIATGPADLVEPMIGRLFSENTLESQLEIVAAMREVMLNTDRKSIAAALRGMAERDSAESLLSEIDVPALFICGAEDRITPLDEMRSVANRVPNAELVCVPNAGHLAPLENPRVVNDAMREFISRN